LTIPLGTITKNPENKYQTVSMVKSQYLEYHGMLYVLDKEYEMDQLWFIVKLIHESNLDKETIIALSKVWKAKKEYQCEYSQETEVMLQQALSTYELQGTLSFRP
jgi:hypothetical protein